MGDQMPKMKFKAKTLSRDAAKLSYALEKALNKI